jgi:hypothetical protein
MQEKKPDSLDQYKLFGIGIIPSMVIIIILTLIVIGLYEYAII